MDRDTALRKIQKCLNLSKSSEPHEAARALRHAQALMDEFNVEHPELLAAGVSEGTAPSRATKSPPSYELHLAHIVAGAFGCKMVFSQGLAICKIGGAYTFIGLGTSAEIASYTFTVLARKLKTSRADYTKTKLTRYTKNKVAAADQFCDGWVRAVARAVPSALGDDSRDGSVAAYMEITYPELGKVKPRRRELANTTRAVDHMVNGYIEGKKAHVNTGISGENATKPSLSMSSQHS
jgi:hypothetical protein